MKDILILTSCVILVFHILDTVESKKMGFSNKLVVVGSSSFLILVLALVSKL